MFGKVRTCIIDGEVWFYAKEVCKALEPGRVGKAVERLDADEWRLKESKPGSSLSKGTGGSIRRIYLINEPGLYMPASQRKGGETPPLEMRMTPQIVRGQKKRGDTLPSICNVYRRRGNILYGSLMRAFFIGGVCREV